MKKIGRLKKFWNRLEALSNAGKIILVFSLLLSMAMCSQAGWIGYYEMHIPAVYEEGFDYPYNKHNVAIMLMKSGEKQKLKLPAMCSSYRLAGIITPFTPPIPIPNFRAISFGKNNPCNFFIVESKPSTSIKLKLEDPKTHKAKTYDPQVTEGSYGYTRNTFPIKSKNLDSGTLVIEKDGEVIEVPFEYKYQKFWH